VGCHSVVCGIHLTESIGKLVRKAGGISFADRACLALARHLDAVAMTSDTAWPNLNLDVRIVLFRKGRRK
jgi:PIN domain nuclease of toxin-antitoxin system